MSDMSEMAALALLAVGVFWAGFQKDSKPIEVMGVWVLMNILAILCRIVKVVAPLQ